VRPPRSLASRVALAAAVGAAVVLVVVGVALIAAVAARERSATDRDLRQAAARLFGPARRLLNRPRLRAVVPPPLLQGAGGLRVRVSDGTAVVFDSRTGPALPAPQVAGLETVSAGGQRFRVLTRGVRLLRPGWLQVVAPLAPVDARVAALRRDVIVAVLAGLAAIAAAVWLLAARALRPLGELRAAAARVSSTRDLTTRLPTGGGPEEVDDVARSLNAMLARLEASAGATERALAAARRFTADAGHELRTPLTSLRANLDVLRRPDLPPQERERVLAEVDADQERLLALLTALQALARGDAGAPPAREPVDLADMADAAVASARRRHPGVAFSLDGAAAAPLDGDPAGLRSIADNLVENAARHGSSRVVVRVEPRRLVVDDDGPGIPPEERERVFERFARGTHARAPGSGLGLAIVAQQAALHGGRARVEESPLGGARMVVELR
jgi:two-component system, OmpR family, sensor histidine kinase PrrB